MAVGGSEPVFAVCSVYVDKARVGVEVSAAVLAIFKAPQAHYGMTRFRDYLTTHGLFTTIRASRGEDIFAACGMLSTAKQEEKMCIRDRDYIALAPKVDANQAYQWLSQSVNAVKGESAAATLFYFLQMSLDKLKADPNHKEQFIQDYLLASEYADARCV